MEECNNMIHGHEVLHMMEGKTYLSAEMLEQEIIMRFGHQARFYTCSAENMTAKELVVFLQERGKFMPSGNSGFTVDKTSICDH